MRIIHIFENFRMSKVTLTSKQNKNITFDVVDGKITNIVNNSGIRFPYNEGTFYNSGIKNWCCNNGFTIDGEDACGEKKVFGIRQKDIPQGHELRRLFPNKFKK